MSAVVGRDASGDAVLGVDGLGEGGAEIRSVLGRHLAEAEQRSNRLEEAFARLRAEREQIGAQAVDPAHLHAAATEQAKAETALLATRDALEAAEQSRAATGPACVAARERETAAAAAHAKLTAESQALAEVLAVKDGERWPPMLDALRVPAWLEAALGAALAEELTSAADHDAARHWRELPPFNPAPALPAGATALAGLVEAPSVLARALSQIGLVDAADLGEARQAELSPGQALVSREGALWQVSVTGSQPRPVFILRRGGTAARPSPSSRNTRSMHSMASLMLTSDLTCSCVSSLAMVSRDCDPGRTPRCPHPRA